MTIMIWLIYLILAKSNVLTDTDDAMDLFFGLSILTVFFDLIIVMSILHP